MRGKLIFKEKLFRFFLALIITRKLRHWADFSLLLPNEDIFTQPYINIAS